MSQPKLHNPSRREFLQTTSAGVAAIATTLWSEAPALEPRSPLEKLNIAGIGAGGMAAADLAQVTTENIVALADVDDNTLQKAGKTYTKAEKYHDYRLLFDMEAHRIDAVVVGTPDHSHAPASLMAMRMGKHCFCEKPLAHSIYETRLMSQVAKEKNLATQLGTNVHASENFRRVVEVIQAGTLGKIREVHVFCNKGWGGGERPKEAMTPPPNLRWDLWLGPSPERPYGPKYHPADWRRWWDFGGGTVGDMACHLVDLPFWALGIRTPSKISAEGPPVHPETAPLGMIARYEFEANGQQPACKLVWYDGELTPKEIAGHAIPGMGMMFVGEKGEMFADYGSYKLYPEKDFAGFKPPEPTIPRSIGHWREWLEACKKGTPTTCNFDYAGALTETVLLGIVAYRTGKTIEWDSAKLEAKNCSEAAKILKPDFRPGWGL